MSVLFAAPADDPRARRPVDVATLVLGVTVIVLSAWLHHVRDDVDTEVAGLFAPGIPDWMHGVAVIAFVLGGLYAITLIVGIAASHGRGAVLRDVAVAVGLTLAGIIVGALAAGPEFPDFLPEFIGREGYPSYPVPRLAVVVAVVVVSDPFLTVPMRRLGRRIVLGTSVAALVLVYGTVTAVVGAFALGVVAAAATRLVFGTGRGIPGRDRISGALEGAGVEPDSFEYLARQPVGAALGRARMRDDTEVAVKIYARDASDAAFAERFWRSMWYRSTDAGLVANRMQLAEHEVLAMLALERVGAPVPKLLSAARTADDDVLVVSVWINDLALDSVDARDVSDGVLDRAWTSLAALHATGVAHGAIDRSRILIGEDRVVFDDLSAARLLADDDAVRSDQAQLLVATALTVGIERALIVAEQHLDRDQSFDLLPFLQSATLSRDLQRDVRRHHLSMKELRRSLATRLEVDVPELAELRRISLGGAVMVVFTVIAAYSLIASLTEIGFGNIVDQMSRASWGWVVVALVVAQLPSFGDYIGLVGLVGRPVPFGPTVLFRYAMLYISLAVPGDAGAIAMSVRYQQKLGVPPAAAIAQGPLLTIVSKLLDIILLLITARFVSTSIDAGEIDFGPVFQLIVLIVIVVVIAVVVVLVVPKWRTALLPHAREGLRSLKGTLTEPDRLMKVIGGSLLQKVLFAIALSAAVAAYGETLSFPSAILVNTIVSLFLGLVPVPGGIGVGEAALSAGLISVGVPEQAAVAAAITHRILTSYLPPVVGWWASRWLTERDYL